MVRRPRSFGSLATIGLALVLAASSSAAPRRLSVLEYFLPYLQDFPPPRTSQPLLPPLLRFPSGHSEDGVWSELDPPARYGHGAIFDVPRNRMIVWGGFDNSEELWSFDLTTRSWQKLHPRGEIPEGRGDVHMIEDPIGHRALFVDGERFDAEGITTFDDVWELTLDEPMTWKRLLITGGKPRARFEPTFTYDSRRHRAILYGGHFENVGPTGEIWELSLDANPAWKRIQAAGQGPSPRYGHTSVYDSRRDRLVVYGGLWYGGDAAESVWSLSLGDSVPTWTVSTAPGPSPGDRQEHVAAYDSLDDRLLVVGGRTGGPADTLDTWQLPLDGSGGWERVVFSGAVPSARAQASLVLDPLSRDLLLYGGQGHIGSTCDVWRMSLDQPPAWEPLSPAGDFPPALYKPVMLYDPPRDRLIVCGRSWLEPDSLVLYATPLGAPTRWVRLRPSGPAPVARAAACAIYDPVRDRMVMFGGVHQSGDGFVAVLSDVWELSLGDNPLWKDISPRVSTTARVGQAAVYDPVGDRMLVFGGFFANDRLTNVIAALSLAGTPTWSDFPVKGPAPEPRSEPAMVYDARRNRVVLWAGNSSHARMDDLWILDLWSSTWREVDEVVRPRVRDSFSAIYDSLGDRLVVHGGFEVGDDWTFGSDTWDLSLSRLLWRELAPSGTMPLGRERHRAVYDSRRDRMIVFGGDVWFDNSSELWELSWNRPRPPNPFTGIGEFGGALPRRGTGGLQLAVANPIRTEASIWFQLPTTSPASLTFFSLAGRKLVSVPVTTSGSAATGYRSLRLDLPSGVYFARLDQDGHSIERKVVVER